MEDGFAGFNDRPRAVGLFAEGGELEGIGSADGVALCHVAQAGIAQTAEAKLVGGNFGTGEEGAVVGGAAECAVEGGVDGFALGIDGEVAKSTEDGIVGDRVSRLQFPFLMQLQFHGWLWVGARAASSCED